MRNIESRVTTGPSNALFASVYVRTFQPPNFTSGAVKGLTIMIYRELNCSIARSCYQGLLVLRGGGGGHCTVHSSAP